MFIFLNIQTNVCVSVHFATTSKHLGAPVLV